MSILLQLFFEGYKGTSPMGGCCFSAIKLLKVQS